MKKKKKKRRRRNMMDFPSNENRNDFPPVNWKEYQVT
jgi:hypothetical protein